MPLRRDESYRGTILAYELLLWILFGRGREGATKVGCTSWSPSSKACRVDGGSSRPRRLGLANGNCSTARAGSYLPKNHTTGPSTARLRVLGDSTPKERIMALRRPVNHVYKVVDILSTKVGQGHIAYQRCHVKGKLTCFRHSSEPRARAGSAPTIVHSF
jgi:hypothetical protein